MNVSLGSRWPLAAAIVAGAVGLVLGAAAVPAVRAEADQAPSCNWVGSTNVQQKVYFAASAYDTMDQRMYIIGGLNEAGEPKEFNQGLDFATATGPGDVRAFSPRNATKRRYGAAAVYVPNLMDPTKKGSVLLIGGSEDPGEEDDAAGRGESDAYEYNIEGNTWSLKTIAGALGERVFHAAAYDPENMIVVVAGGVRQCAFEGPLAGNGCPADSLPTALIKLDPATGDASIMASAAGSLQIYGHSMVYDSVGKRMLLHGGTRSGTQADPATWALDMTNAATANWTQVASGGPRVAFHTAAYDADNNWMVVHGGATGQFINQSEATNTRTHALELGAMGGASWSDLGTQSSPTDRVGAVAAYAMGSSVKGVVMATGRRKQSSRDTQTAQNSSEILVCGAATPTTPATTTTPVTPGTPTPVTPTATGGTPVTPTATVGPKDPEAESCDSITGKVPAAAIAQALADPDSVSGWKELCHPNLPASPFNTLRQHLDIRNPGAPFHPIYNSLVFRCGCR